jgi:hypothetical protein
MNPMCLGVARFGDTTQDACCYCDVLACVVEVRNILGTLNDLVLHLTVPRLHVTVGLPWTLMLC